MKIITINNEGIVFDNGTTIQNVHDQDCCESVYADWEQLKDTGIMNREFEKIDIKGVKDSGFILNGYFVPCYNNQNGYYGSDLGLTISYVDGKSEEIDISAFVEDNID
ncbi:hypothetical protein M0R04_14465 [Candidatus Dojkabacteria bacterium]|jgi:hypothetical protein|nr:hypothetical protein [Candidatus Dojkabacteria bacterium]